MPLAFSGGSHLSMANLVFLHSPLFFLCFSLKLMTLPSGEGGGEAVGRGTPRPPVVGHPVTMDEVPRSAALHERIG